MSYTNAIQTKLLSTNCCCCGRPLVDSISVELGIGPECRKGYDAGIDSETKEKCNKLTYKAAIAAQNGFVPEVKRIAQDIEDLGLKTLADKIRRRFINTAKNVKILINLSKDGKYYLVKTPFCRSRKNEFVQSWRDVKGRFYKKDVNYVPVESKEQLWTLLQEYFNGQFGLGPLGVFRIMK